MTDIDIEFICEGCGRSGSVQLRGEIPDGASLRVRRCGICGDLPVDPCRDCGGAGEADGRHRRRFGIVIETRREATE